MSKERRQKGEPGLEPAWSFIRALGGPSLVAREIGASAKRVIMWAVPREQEGCGGRVPFHAINRMVVLANRKGVPYTFDDEGRLCLDVEKIAKQQARKAKTK